MNKRKFNTWVIEFISITAIGIILQKDYSIHWVIIPTMLILGLKFYEYQLDVNAEYLKIRAQLIQLIKLLSEEQVIDLGTIRCTYHVPIWFWGKMYLQTFDYIPLGGGGRRTLPMNKGITGETFNKKRSLVENFQNGEEYHREMLDEYNYRIEELREIRADRMSYFTYPITDENHKVLGVIYFDSSIVNTFTSDDDSPKMKKIICACETINDNIL